jgi:hypothetical protein
LYWIVVAIIAVAVVGGVIWFIARARGRGSNSS